MKLTLGFIFTLLALVCSIHYSLAASASVKKELGLKQHLAKEALHEELENADVEDIEPENKLLQPINEEDAAEAELENENDFNNDDDVDDIDDDLLLNDDDDEVNALQEAKDKNILNDDLDDLEDNEDINELAEVEEARARRRRRQGRKNRRNRRARRNRKNRKGRRNRRYRRRRNRSG